MPVYIERAAAEDYDGHRQGLQARAPRYDVDE